MATNRKMGVGNIKMICGKAVQGQSKGEGSEFCVWGPQVTLYNDGCILFFHLRPYRDEPSASRPIRADKHRRGQRVLTWVTSREHCAAAGIFLFPQPMKT